MSSSKNIDVINICGESTGGHCGYCNKQNDDKATYGITCDKMKPETYLYLMNRGWRRCGTYFYKPFNDVTCCPLYPIRCNANEFKLSKSHRKILKRMKNFLINGKVIKTQKVNAGGDTCSSENSGTQQKESKQILSKKTDKSRKSKTIRYNLKLDKLRKQAISESKSFEDLLNGYKQRRSKRLQKNREILLHEYLDYSNIKVAKHSLTIKTVRCCPTSDKFNEIVAKEHRVYEKYQCSIHKDKPDEVTLKQFKRFLVEGGLSFGQSMEEIDLSRRTLRLSQGQYHQQYWLDDEQIIAVGVIDILPIGVSSVYLFYDPEFGFLNLGTYTALTEINFVNELRQKTDEDDFIYYYMGFYVHNCVKMRYKAQFNPSYIACPITFDWVPVDVCQRILDRNKYGRFAEPGVSDSLSLNMKTFAQIADLTTVTSQGKSYKLNKIKDKITPFFLNEIESLVKLLGAKVLRNIQISL